MGPAHSIVSKCRTFATTRVPERDHLKIVPAHPVVHEVANPWEVQATHNFNAWRFYFGANAWLQNQQGKRHFKVFTDGTGRGESVLCPPFGRSFDLALGARFDSYRERQDQPKRRSRASISSVEIPASRSASSRASRSSASSSGVSRTGASPPRAKMVTTVPSGRESPATSTLPSTTVPVAICMRWMVVHSPSPGKRHRMLDGIGIVLVQGGVGRTSGASEARSRSSGSRAAAVLSRPASTPPMCSTIIYAARSASPATGAVSVRAWSAPDWRMSWVDW